MMRDIRPGMVFVCQYYIDMVISARYISKEEVRYYLNQDNVEQMFMVEVFTISINGPIDIRKMWGLGEHSVYGSGWTLAFSP